MSLADQEKFQELINKFRTLFLDMPGYTHVLSHEINTGDNRAIKQKFYRYGKTEIIEWYVQKMLKEGIVERIDSPFFSPVVLCRKKKANHLKIQRLVGSR